MRRAQQSLALCRLSLSWFRRWCRRSPRFCGLSRLRSCGLFGFGFRWFAALPVLATMPSRTWRNGMAIRESLATLVSWGFVALLVSPVFCGLLVSARGRH
jgi:hypothetical protein